MNKRYFIYIPLIVLSSILLTGCTKKNTEYDNVEIVDTEREETESEEKPKAENGDLGYLANPQDFAKTRKSIGEESDVEYTIDGLEDVQSQGYHSFNFNISTSAETEVLPLITVDPVLDKGVYRVTVKNIGNDSSGIAYQQSKAVNKGAVTGIYRAVTSAPKTAVYEIGFLGNNPFQLDYSQTGSSGWVVSVRVAYDLKYSPPTVDFGSSEFSSNEQKITGVTSDNGARISSYSYSVSNGVLKFVFSTASGTSNPIPSVEAKYDDMNILDVKFTSLSADKVATWGNTITLPSGIVVNVSRAGEVSSYRFGGIGAARPFKLSATQSPNQVIVEIQLN